MGNLHVTGLLTPDKKTRYYVIIGRGFSGILNHVMLRHHSDQRLGRLPILHIGEPDPWRNYHPMPMGQWPTLLTLPGFTNQPSALNPYTNLESSEFADVNEREWNRLRKDHPFSYVAGHVVAIRASADWNNRYEVVLDNKDIFQADYVDVCGGPGPARTPSMTIDDPLMSEFNGNAVGPDGWRRLVSGEVFLDARTKPVPRKQRICVYGGGPTGAWCVEHAQSLEHTVHWVAKEELNTAFVASRRNDDLLHGEVVREKVGDDHVVTGPLRPASSSTFFGEKLVATKIAPTTAGAVEIFFAPASSAGWQLTGSTGPIPPEPVLTVQAEQVVLSIGQQTGDQEPRSWASLLRPVLVDAIHTRNHLIIDGQRRVVGLRSKDGCVRVLGAAALSHPAVVAEWQKPGSPSKLFFRSLVEQARVPIGITLSAISVAEANRLWDFQMLPNDNRNTCGLEDLMRLTGGLRVELRGAETWFEMRGARIPPFDLSEFDNFAAGKVSY